MLVNSVKSISLQINTTQANTSCETSLKRRLDHAMNVILACLTN